MDGKMSVATYMNYWLETYPKVNCQPSTYKRYKEFANDIKTYLGMYKLSKLNPLMVQKFYSNLKVERKLSNNTIIKVHRMFHLGLKHAQKWQLIFVNPCDLVTTPPSVETEMKYWNPEDITGYLDELKDEFLYPYIYLAVHTDLREGELCALLWEDGRPMDPHYIAQNFPLLFTSHKNVPKIRFHDLRHTHASPLRKLKVDPKVISDRLRSCGCCIHA